MNIPHIEIAPEEARQLEEVRRGFATEMSQLDRKAQLARATVIAGGIRKRDPLTRALAQQMVDVDRLNRQAEAAEREIAEIDATRRVKGYDPGPAMLGRKVQLEEHIAKLRARQIGIVESDLTSARQKAVKSFREEAQRRDKEQRLADAITRQTAEAEQADIEARAAQIVRGKRLGAGKAPSKAGEAQ
jgi:hypothetical protein